MTKNIRRLTLAALTLAGLAAGAATTKGKITVLGEGEIQGLQPADMADGQLYFYYDPQIGKTNGYGAFTDWKAKAPTEARFLSLYDGYEEPTFTRRSGDRPLQEKITMFVSKAKTVVNRRPEDIEISKMIQKDFIDALDPSVHNFPMTPAANMIEVARAQGAGKAPAVDPFRACNNGYVSNDISRHLREIDLDVLQRPKTPWCTGENSRCYSSCSIFSDGWRAAVTLINTTYRAMLKADSVKDSGVASQAEFRYFRKESEMGMNGASLSDLTGLDTEVVGVLEGSSFYFNQVIQYGKVLIVFQRHPNDPAKTVMSGFFAVGLRTRSFEDHALLKDVIMGRSKKLNTKTGYTMGLPAFTASTLLNVAGQLNTK